MHLSFLCLVLIVIVPGLHIVQASMMIHSLFFLSNIRISGLFAPFIGHFPISRVYPTRSLLRCPLGLVADTIAGTTG